MDNDIIDNRPPRNNKVLAGLILMGVGAAFLLHQLNFFFFPYWLFSWPVFLIVWGLFIGARHNFKRPFWLILVVFGVFFLLDDILPYPHFSHIFWPLVIIAIGIRMIVHRNHINWAGNMDWRSKGFNQPPPPPDLTSTKSFFNDDYLDATSIFSGIKKKVLSKDFKGGDIVNIFGGADVDFTQADINGRVFIDVTQVFGGIKLIVPPHWHVTSDMVVLFAGFDDKRMQKSDFGSDKILVLKGTSIFAGIEIRSY